MSFFMIFCEVVAFFCVIPDLLEKIEETLLSHAFASFMHITAILSCDAERGERVLPLYLIAILA